MSEKISAVERGFQDLPGDCIRNSNCPYGYSFCYKCSWSKDARYLKTLRCNWFVGQPGVFESYWCMEISYVKNDD